MNVEQEIYDLKEEITNLKKLLYRNHLLQYGDFLSDTDKADIMNKKKCTCLICLKAKTPEEFDEYSLETGKGICKLCRNTHFPGNE